MTAYLIVTVLSCATLAGVCAYLLVRDRQCRKQLEAANISIASLSEHTNAQLRNFQLYCDAANKKLSDRIITFETQNKPVIEREADKPFRGRGWIAQREQIQQEEMNLVS